MGTLGSAPALTVWPNNGQQDVFWKGYGNDKIYEAYWNNGWHGPFVDPPGVTNAASAPTATVNTARSEEDVFWKATDGTLWEEVWSESAGWLGAHQIANMGTLG
jgi:hypothetical protein